MNPASAAADYSVNAPKFNVLEPDVIYYNTRAAANKLNITSPQNFWVGATPKAATYGIYGKLEAKE